MQRRTFLGLAGVGAMGAGAMGRELLGSVRTGAGSSPGAVADADIEQPLVPYRGSHRILWSVETEEPRAALTFDDGPDPDLTPRILEVLAEHDVRATFLMMGYNAAEHEELARTVVEQGHEVGNHTWTHLNLLRETDQNQYEELVRGHDTIVEVTGAEPRYFRPPRGQLTGASLRHAARLGYDTVLWSVDRGAPGIATATEVSDYADVHLGAGDIFLLHDGIGRGTFNPDADYARENRRRREVEVAALPRILEEAGSRGLALGTVSELLAVERPPRPPVRDEGG